MADDELFYTNFGIDQAGDIVGRLMSACVCGPLDPDDACLSCCARTEIERLRAQLAEMLPLCEDIVIGERIRERDANDNGHRTPLGEVAADFGIDLTLDEIERLRAAGDALADALRSGSDREWDKAIDDWEEARRG